LNYYHTGQVVLAQQARVFRLCDAGFLRRGCTIS
jgi:hypothetical protein